MPKRLRFGDVLGPSENEARSSRDLNRAGSPLIRAMIKSLDPMAIIPAVPNNLESRLQVGKATGWPPHGAIRRRSLRQRWIVDPIVSQLTQGITVEKIALSFAVGSLCAFFPILGVATPLCLVAGAALRLNQAIVQIINWTTAPIYFPLVFAFIQLGDFLLGTARAPLDPGLVAARLRSDPGQFLHSFGAIAGHALLGWAVLAPIWVAVGYFISLLVLRTVVAGRRHPRRNRGGHTIFHCKF